MSDESYSQHLQAEREEISLAAVESSGLMNLLTRYYVVGDEVYTKQQSIPTKPVQK